MHPLDIFKDIFPSHRLIEIHGELRYVLHSDLVANAYSIVAGAVIVAKGLPLITMVDIWRSRGQVREIALVVRMAPEQDVVERICGDEVQDDEGLNGGGAWGYNSGDE